MHILDQILDRVREVTSTGALPVVVFDLDSTLYDTAFRHHRILSEFQADFGPVWPVLNEVVPGLAPADFHWTVGGPLKRAGVDKPALFETLHRFWFERFFSNEYLTADQPHAGAVPYVQSIHEAGAYVYYLTGRPQLEMGQGTTAALFRSGFPYYRGRTCLHMKPRADLDDGRFKAAALKDIRSLRGQVVATFENEPAHANRFAEAFPDATHVLLDTCHTPGAPEPASEIVAVRNFLRD